MERNSPINSVYLIALAVCSLVLVVNSFYNALIFGIVVVAVFLVSTSIVAMVEKIADKHIRFLLFALVSAALVIILKLVCGYVNVKEIVFAGETLEFACIPCMLLALIPIYFESKLTVKDFFGGALLSSAGFLLMLLLFGTIVEVLGYGTFAGMNIAGFDGIEFFTKSYGCYMVIATLTILFNIVRRTYLKKTRHFNMLVEKYKIQIREIHDTRLRVRAGERRDYNE